MSDREAADGLLDLLVEGFAQEVVRKYRVDSAEAATLIRADWARRPKLLDAIARAASVEEVQRLRVYQDAAAATKRDIYNRLRRYRAKGSAADEAYAALAALSPGVDDAELTERRTAVAAAHVSTAERLPHLGAFFDELSAAVGTPASIVDVGSGVLPLVYPLDDVREYWALDKDVQAIAAVREYARLRGDTVVHPLEWNLADGWAAAHAAGLPPRVDVGLLLKVVPVVARQAPAQLATLADTPAGLLVVSGSRVAMAKRQDIERRETKVLQRFAAEHGLVERARFRTPDEICLVLERDR